jgi:hypothetical protein
MLLGNTLFITTKNLGSSGASVISERNYHLVSLNSFQVIHYSTELTLKNVRKNLKSILIDFNLVNKLEIKEIAGLIKNNFINTVFIDTSLLGNFSKYIKKEFPNIYIISFFHNVEYTYFVDLIKVSKKKQHYFTLKLVKKAESQLIHFSDSIISLNRRDSNDLYKTYGKYADLILPTSFDDQFDKTMFENKTLESEVLNLLFVGSYFPPNVYGLDWFVDNVLPKINRKVQLFVVGNGFEVHKFKKENKLIDLIGKVDNLSTYYYNADLIIAPIFHGSGMKTKVAEALMYNKPVVGSKEAFEGYEIDVNEVGKVCNTAEEYINYIQNFSNSPENIRALFLANFSFETIKNNFYNFLNDAK